MKRLVFGGAPCIALALACPAFAHITLETRTAPPSAPYKAVLRVSHGCAGSPTTAIAVTIPEGIIAAKPMPKAGWTIAIARHPYKKAYAFFHGATLAEGATTITWSGGPLPDDEYDEFVFSAFVSDAFKPGATVAFPTVQTCAVGSVDWSGGDGKTPAPILTIGAPTSGDEHHHH